MSIAKNNRDEAFKNNTDEASQVKDLQKSMSSIKHKFLVMSSKGGVGKTSVIVNLALALSMKGMKVGLMDLNYNSPEIHKLFGLELFSTGPGNRAVFLGFYIPHISLDLYQKEAMEAAEKFMNRVCEQQMKGCPNFERRILSGDPAAEILKTIDSEAVDLVVMGTHGYKGLEQAIFGSVARKVVKNSPVPVLTINPYKLK